MPIWDILRKRPSAQAQVPVGYPVHTGMPLPGPVPQPAPVEQVISMQQQGATTNQIIDSLQRQGYQPQQIYDALDMAEARAQGAEPMPSVPAPELSAAPDQRKGFEEVAESIVSEKWQDFTKELAKFTEWQNASASRLDRIEQSVTDLKSDVESLHKAIVSKISEYDRNLLDVGTEIKAMEKVFQKVLPELTGSVSELSRITKSAKSASSRPSAARKK